MMFLLAGLGIAGAALLLAWNIRLRRRIADLGTITEPATASLASQQLAEVQHRLLPAHPVSGLPVREALLARITADHVGILGAIAFADFDRLTAFDPALGERVLAASAARLRNMVPPHRFIAQVDRGHVGLWFGDEIGEADARAELNAIAYALGAAIDDGATRIIPEIRLRLARFRADQGLSPAAFVTRTLASFTLPNGAEVAPDLPTTDYAALARERYALEQSLRQAVSRRELRLEFQPLIDASRGRINGAEALLRWNHTEHGEVPPAQFVPIMEAVGLSSEIGLWVLNAAAREARDWVVQGLGDLRVAVNVSGLQLERDDLPIVVQRTLQRHELSPSALEIELTESVATSDATHCRRIFEELRAIGVKLAVDDFGTGYSGFSTLRTLAFDKIKIDREFVTDIDRRPDSQAICQSIIALGRGLGIRVLAEGVERHGEYAWLRRHGCQHFQGYYFGRPMAGRAFAAFVRDRAQLTNLLRIHPTTDQITEKLQA